MNWVSFVVLAVLVSQKSVVRHAPLSCFTISSCLGSDEPLRRPISLVGPERVGLVTGGQLHAFGQDDFSSLSLHLFISGDCRPKIVLMCFSNDELHTCKVLNI